MLDEQKLKDRIKVYEYQRDVALAHLGYYAQETGTIDRVLQISVDIQRYTAAIKAYKDCLDPSAIEEFHAIQTLNQIKEEEKHGERE